MTGSSWRSGLWRCQNGHVVESEEEPTEPCERYGNDEWTELVLVAQHPREGQWGTIECARCGYEFHEYNGESTAGWHCKGCDGWIIPKTHTPKPLVEPREPVETHQTGLFAVTDGGDGSV